MPLHFMLSEIVICSVAFAGTFRLWLNGQSLGSMGVMLFGLAAAIGIIRIASGAQDIIADAHRFAAQAGGAFGLVLIVAEFSRLRGWRLQLPAVITSAGIAALAVLTGGSWAGLVFLVLLLTGALIIVFHQGRKYRAPVAIGFALMASNILFVRQSPFLDTGTGWHAYHLLTALWIAIVITGLQTGGIRSVKRAPSS